MKALLIILSLIYTQGSYACQISEEVFQSKILSQDTQTRFLEKYLVVRPKNFDPRKTYGAVYFLHGRGGDRYFIRDLGVCEFMDQLSEENKANFIIIAPDGRNSYWMNGALTHERWADMVTSELIQDAEAKLPLKRTKSSRVIAGISMGGHGAVQIGLNYPHVFGAIGAHSAVFRTQEEASRDFYYEFGIGEDFARRDPFSLLRSGKRFAAPIYLDMGGQDEWIRNTRNFSLYLHEIGFQGVTYVGTDAVGGHRNGYWQYHLPHYLRWYSYQIQFSL